MTRRILFGATALLAAMFAAEYPRGLRAQSLSLPTYTSSQAAQGKQAYEKACAACHGTNLDDGEFAPPLKGVDFRLRWGGKPVEALFDADVPRQCRRVRRARSVTRRMPSSLRT